MSQRTPFIVYYTVAEGTGWRACNWKLPTQKELDNARVNAAANKSNTIHLFTEVGTYAIHSFKVSDGREWDVANGWRPNVPL